MNPVVGSAVVGGGLNTIGDILGANSAQAANRMNLQIAREQMGFQASMSNTAHQREVDDLMRAGLNPILSATRGAGASTPPGASAHMEPVYTRKTDYMQSIASAMQLKLLSSQESLIRAQAAEHAASARSIESSLPHKESTAEIYRKYGIPLAVFDEIMSRGLKILGTGAAVAALPGLITTYLSRKGIKVTYDQARSIGTEIMRRKRGRP